MAATLTLPLAADAFLDRAGWGGARIVPIPGDASFRRYFRIVDGQRSAILMDSPPATEDATPFVTVARWLAGHGFPAPAIMAEAPADGLLLLEDFGDARMRDAIDAEPVIEDACYTHAIDLLARLHAVEPAPLPRYDHEHYARELALLTEWYCPAIGVEVDGAAFLSAWDEALALVEPARPVTVLRDYHAENLMLLEGGRSLGLLDFQDALVGHPAYDLVSLLQDARRDVPPAVEAAMIERYLAASPVADAGFEAAYRVLGAQRNVKIIGIFTRLWKRDGKPRYPALAPRVWRYLEADLRHPALARVRDWFDTHLPQHLRGDPMAIAR